MLRARHAPVRHVHRDHPDPAARRRHRARLGMREPRRAGEPRHHVVQPHAREDRHPVPRRLAVSRDGVAAAGELVAEQLGERVVGELGLLQADHVRLPLVQPGQQPRHPLLDRVDVPRRDPHGPHGSCSADTAGSAGDLMATRHTLRQSRCSSNTCPRCRSRTKLSGRRPGTSSSSSAARSIEEPEIAEVVDSPAVGLDRHGPEGPAVRARCSRSTSARRTSAASRRAPRRSCSAAQALGVGPGRRGHRPHDDVRRVRQRGRAHRRDAGVRRLRAPDAG